MSKGSNIQVFGELIGQKIRTAQKVQTHWSIVKEVDWENKTMTATGVTDDLDFQEVHLGLGSFYRKPKTGSMCLIGVIENQEASTFLIECEAFEEAVYKCDDTLFRIKENGYVVQQGDENLQVLILDLIKAIKNMKFTTNTGSTINLINLPEFVALEPRFKQILKTD